jgi:hypothetical protein
MTNRSIAATRHSGLTRSVILAVVFATLTTLALSGSSCLLAERQADRRASAESGENLGTLSLALKRNFGMACSISTFWCETQKDWQSTLEWAIGKDPLAERDRQMGQLAVLAKRVGAESDFRCVVLEHICVGASGHPGTYENLVMYGPAVAGGGPSKDLLTVLTSLRAVQLDYPRWLLLESIVGPLLRQGPSDNGRQTNALDVFLVSVFDGWHWKTEQFSNFEELTYEGPPYQDLQGTSLFFLLYFANDLLGPEVSFAQNRYQGFVGQLAK